MYGAAIAKKSQKGGIKLGALEGGICDAPTASLLKSDHQVCKPLPWRTFGHFWHHRESWVFSRGRGAREGKERDWARILLRRTVLILDSVPPLGAWWGPSHRYWHPPKPDFLETTKENIELIFGEKLRDGGGEVGKERERLVSPGPTSTLYHSNFLKI